MALNLPTTPHIQAPEFAIGDEVKISASLPAMEGYLIYIRKNEETKFDPPFYLMFTPNDGYTFTILKKKDSPPPERTSMGHGGPNPMDLYRYKLTVHLPEFKRKEYLQVNDVSIKTLIPFSAIVLVSTGKRDAQGMYEHGAKVRLVRDMTLELYNAPKKTYKTGTLFRVDGVPWSSHRGVPVKPNTRPESSKYACILMREIDVVGDTHWISTDFHPISALTAA